MPPAGQPDPKGQEWLVLVDPTGHPFCIVVRELTPFSTVSSD